jgi:hypothetical protein
MFTVRQSFLPVAIVICLFLPAVAQTQQSIGRAVIFPVTIQWPRQKGIFRYRLQIAADPQFRDIYVDRRLVGNRHVVDDLQPGEYYWRVATAEARVGVFSMPVKFFISGGVITPVTFPNHVANPAQATRPRSYSKN